MCLTPDVIRISLCDPLPSYSIIRCHDLTFAFYYRLVEEADYNSTIELFSKKGDNKTFDNFIPKFESDFVEYAELISHKLRPYELMSKILYLRSQQFLLDLSNIIFFCRMGRLRLGRRRVLRR
ncbi:hypothetical protein Goshw_030081 [Gossypium schwendimanii]|uniref:Uncharacterized protein n=1 Tax=Gossypium schwendimanii TaxID=34291 RepID=A0A7J9MF03_GOSSC|nr:hypothetical protein [Gossypium schwendimanii]